MNSIRIKASAFLLMLILGTVGILAYLSLNGIRHYQIEQLETFLATQARTANVIAAKNLDTETQKTIIRQMTSDALMSAAIYDKTGKLLMASSFQNEINPRNDWAKTALKEALSGKIAYSQLSAEETYGNPIVDYYAPLYVEENQIGVLRLSYQYQGYMVFYEAMVKQITIVSALVFITATLIGLWYFGRQAKLVETLKNAVKQVEENRGRGIDQLGLHRLKHRKDEYGDLGRGLEQMTQTLDNQFVQLLEEQEKLKKAVERLREMEQSQRQFFGNVTHEFKTPLSVINAVNDLAELYPDDPDLAKDRYVKIKAEVQRLTAMVEQALALSRASRYDFELQWTSVDINALLARVVERLSPKAEKYGITLDFKASEEASTALIDEEALTQMVVNLVDNAIKYNHRGGSVWVTTENRDKIVRISVKDTGIGMTDAQKANIFMPFTSKNLDNVTEFRGSGLGLTLVKQLADQLGARVMLINSDEKGSEMAIEVTRNCHETDKTLK